MDMSTPYEWLTQPVQLHSSRAHKCTMTAEQCAFKYRRWVNWYLADLVYGRNAVYFFTATIGVFIVAYALGRLLPRSTRQGPAWLKTVALTRLLSYPDVRLRRLRWNSPSLGVCLLGAVGLIFFMGISLGPHPYYWPNTATVSYGDSPPIATRSGYLSLACLPFIFAFGAKANLVTALTGIAPEKLIVFHLFAAWGMFVLALMHTFPFVVYHTAAGDIAENWSASAQWLTGVVALVAQAWLTFMSLPFVRHRAYEFFKAMHFLAALVFVVFLFLHCDFTLTSWDYFIATGTIYLASLLFTMGRTYFAHGLLRAHLVLESEQTLKIAIPAGALRWRPGQHLYLRFLTLGVHALTAHPFTICSVSAAEDKKTATPSELVFYIKPRGGLTGRLAALARKQPGAAIPVFVEGPYGGVPHRWGEGFDKTLMVSGGAGAGFSLGLIEDWMARRGSGSPELLAVVSSRDPGMRRWFVDALHQIAEKYSTAGVRIVLHETGAAASTNRPSNESSTALALGETTSTEVGKTDQDASSDEKPGRGSSAASNLVDITYRHGQADLSALVRELGGTRSAHVGVAVCGPSSMAHDVAMACAVEQRRILGGGPGASEVWLHQEGFTN